MANLLGLVIAVFFSISLISYFAIKNFVISESKEQLELNIKLLQLSDLQDVDLQELSRQVNTTTKDRITIITLEGEVLADSTGNASQMENHAKREEIIAANTAVFGHAVRNSTTTHIEYLYVAKKVPLNSRELYLRMATPLSKILSNFYHLWFQIVVVLLSFTIIAVAISINMSKKVRYDIKQITNYLDAIANKEYKAVLKTKHFSEFLYIALNLKEMAKKLSTRAKQKRKHTARLRLMNRQRNDILSAISHEFKNPVAAILGFSETLIDDPDIDPTMRNRFLEKIRNNTMKITQMIDRIALAIKLENNDLTVQRSEFDLSEVVKEAIQNQNSKYRDRTISFDEKPKTIYADKIMIDNVVTNLIDNALKYSQDDVKVVYKDKKLLVVDRGIGISEEELTKISAKFYRVEKNSWDNSMGLGLAIVSFILQLHDTTLFIKSEETEGSSFGFSFENMTKKRQ